MWNTSILDRFVISIESKDTEVVSVVTAVDIDGGGVLCSFSMVVSSAVLFCNCGDGGGGERIIVSMVMEGLKSSSDGVQSKLEASPSSASAFLRSIVELELSICCVWLDVVFPWGMVLVFLEIVIFDPISIWMNAL